MDQTLTEFATKYGITLDYERESARPDPNFANAPHMVKHWRCTLKRDGKHFTIHYSTGSGIKDDPTVEDILNCVSLDSSSLLNGRDGWASLKEWCDEYGYDPEVPDSRRFYREVWKQAEKMRTFLGIDEALRELAFETETL